MEAATGRRPRDIVDVENMDPTQLSTDPLLADKLDRELQKLALAKHQEARQLQDLRQDIARNLRPSEGPFSAGESFLLG